MREKEALFIYKLEQKFGKNFEISVKELASFIKEEINNDLTIYEVLSIMYRFYRDDYIDLESLENIIEYLGYLPDKRIKVVGDKAKELLRKLSQYVSSDHEMFVRLHHEYQCKNISITLYEIAVMLMGNILPKSFLDMPEEERLTVTWMYDLDGNYVSVNKKAKKFIDTYLGILNLDNTGILIPSYDYVNNFDFIRDYMEQRGISNQTLKNAGLYHKYKGQLSSYGFKKKIDIFRMIITLDLSTSISKQFLSICGFSFDPFDKIDMFILDYLNGKYKKANDFHEFVEMYDEKFKNSNVKEKYFEWPNWQ